MQVRSTALVLSCFALLAASASVAVSAQGTVPTTQNVKTSRTYEQESYSSDWSKVAFVAARQGDACPRVYVSNADGSDLHAVSPAGGSVNAAALFPQGDRVVYSETRCPAPATAFPPSNLFVVNRDGSTRVQLTTGSAYNGEPTVAPDGRTVVFSSTRGGRPGIYKLSIDDSKLEQLTTDFGYEGAPLFSPDGEWLALRVLRPSRGEFVGAADAPKDDHVELWVMRSDGSSKRQLTTDSASFGPYFSADSKRVVFGTRFGRAPGQTGEDVFAANLENDEVIRITHAFDPTQRKQLKELEATYIGNMNNRERLRESLPFGILKVIAYVFLGCSFLLILFRITSAAVLGLGRLLLRIEHFLLHRGFHVDVGTELSDRKEAPAATVRVRNRVSRRKHKETLPTP